MGKYVERNLYENEWVVEKAPRDVWGLVGWWILGVLFCWVLFIPLIKAIKETVIFNTTEFVLTNKRVIYKWGVFHTRALDVPLLKVKSVTVDRGFWGRIFNVGSIHIETPKGSIRERLQDAEEFKTAILAQIDQFELDRLSLQADWTAQALLRGSNGVNPYAPKQPQPAPETSPEFDPYGGYGRNPLTGKRN